MSGGGCVMGKWGRIVKMEMEKGSKGIRGMRRLDRV